MSVSPDQQKPDPPQNQDSSWGEITITRRQFFGFSILGGTAASLGVLSRPAVSEAIAEKLDRKSILDRLSDELVSNRRSALLTAVETVLVWIGNMALEKVLDRTNIVHGGHTGDGIRYAEEVAKHPIGTYIRDNVAVPVIEEVFFRLVPSAFFSEDLAPKVQLRWDVGLTSTAIFALVHNLSKPEADKITIHLNSLPLEQLVIGAYCWYAQRKGGFIHAAGAHVLYNNLCSLCPNLFDSGNSGQPKES